MSFSLIDLQELKEKNNKPVVMLKKSFAFILTLIIDFDFS